MITASKSADGTVRIWNSISWQNLVTMAGFHQDDTYSNNIAFHPNLPNQFASISANGKSIQVWSIDRNIVQNSPSQQKTVYYTTAKIALVGDSGVGKSGLGYRIADNMFRLTASTHGQQFWVVPKLGKTRVDGTQCEAVLWDFAGQPDFRPIHALFLDNIDLALLLFDPSRPDTFKDLSYWLNQLSYSGKRINTILVAARSDVSSLNYTTDELNAFCHERNISGGFITTSAKTNMGMDKLISLIQAQIDWESKPATVTTESFRWVKNYILSLKSNSNITNAIISPSQLKGFVEAANSGRQFSMNEIMGVAGQLQNHGYLFLLHKTASEVNILLIPDLLINLAASVMHQARVNEKGLGALQESKVLRNEYKFPDLDNLMNTESELLLNAVIELFLNHTICFRESIDDQTFLIFPSLILDHPPRLIAGADYIEAMTYLVSGPVENIYPSLVVLMGYSPSFQRTNQWRNQAQFETRRGEICGFKELSEDSARLELVLYYGKNTPDYVRARFQGLFEEILYTHELNISKFPPLYCPLCKQLQDRKTIIRRMNEGKSYIHCAEDGRQIVISEVSERIQLSEDEHSEVAREQIISKMRTNYETSLVRIKGYLRDKKNTSAPSCFISYAWGNKPHERWINKFCDDLRKADIKVILDQWDNPAIGSNISRFISQIENSDFIVVVGTSDYLKKYENKISNYGSVVAAEVDLINVRLIGTEEQKATILPVLLEGHANAVLPPLLKGRVIADFATEEKYFASLFDLILTMLKINFGDSLVRDLRSNMYQDALF